MDHCSAESQKAIKLLKTAKGQVDGVLRMVEEDRYCVDVSKQIMAAMAVLKKANLLILRQHLDTCVRDAMKSDDAGSKIDEIAEILETYL